MSGTILADIRNASSEVLFEKLAVRTETQSKGMHEASLTNLDNSTIPAIAGGSVVEVDGAIAVFGSDESIGGSPSDGTVYIKLIPATTTITAEFTNTAPVWDEDKEGWYSPTGGEENYRYLNWSMVKSGTDYTDKLQRLKQKQNCNMSALSYTMSANQTVIAGVSYQWDLIEFDTKEIDYKSEYSTVNNYITIDETGLYRIDLQVVASRASLTNFIVGLSTAWPLSAITSDIFSYLYGVTYESASAIRASVTISAVKFFEAGDIIYPFLALLTTSNNVDIDDNGTKLTMNRIV